jgi:glycosyltransferase involved in cell wall biosynthesis
VNRRKLLSEFRVTVVHSYYRGSSISGENLAVDMQVSALKDAGARVDLIERSTDIMSNRKLYPVESWLRIATKRDISGTALPECESDDHILLVNNLFPNFGLESVMKWNGPIISMIHNYRTFCANGLLLRDGKFCDQCLHGNSLPAVVHGCYKSSRLASIPLAIATRGGAQTNPLMARSDRIICQSGRAQRIFVDAGIDPKKLSLIPGFTKEPEPGMRISTNNNRWVFVGRLSAEKGLFNLMHEWPPSVELDVIGDGEEFESVLVEKPKSVELLGRKPHEDILASLGSYIGLVYPGVCSEGAYPMVLREALARGLPVIAAEGSSAADLISMSGGGLVYRPGEGDLHTKLQQVELNRSEYSIQASDVYREVLGQDVWTTKMSGVFTEALNERKLFCENQTKTTFE